ncbi:dihydropteroate synthase [Alphaproteobacteria bacterium]|nr:dihydropteroate synthase [Alphaproteobacteria bacterium]
MSVLKKNRYLLAPPFSNSVETFISPIAKSKHEVLDGLKIAQGWRYFNELKVLQKDNNIYSEVIMSPSKLLQICKKESKESLIEAERLIHCITKKRPSFSNLDMSQFHIMGVINTTPDSFYKNSQLTSSNSIVKKSLKMASDGASIIDIGGESTRPGAKEVSVNEEIKRVMPSIIHLKNNGLGIQVSLDTRNLSTMKLGFENGVDIFNDISGFTDHNKMKFISKLKLPIIVMHMQNKPHNMQNEPKYRFAPIDIYNILSKRVNQLIDVGIDKSNIVVDPGIGFGKNIDHNLEILRNISLFQSLGVPILIGVSRKSVVSEVTINAYKRQGINKKLISPTKRLSGSLAFAIHAYNNGIQLIRTHDVFETKQAIICQDAMN